MEWRHVRESNPSTRFCRPLRNRSANAPSTAHYTRLEESYRATINTYIDIRTIKGGSMEQKIKPTAPGSIAKEGSAAAESRITRVKTAFLYTLIGGLAIAALTSVTALLVGEFNAVIGKTLSTIFILFTHSMLLLAILWADEKNELGKSIISTTIFVSVFASLITTTLSAWDILSNSAAWRWTGLYFLAIGGAFIITALLRLRVNNQSVQISINTSVGLVAAALVALTPWVLKVVPNFDPLYFRIVGALSILASASFLIAFIFRGIATSKDASLPKQPQQHNLPGGLLAIYIIVGIVTAIVWNVGFASLIDSGSRANETQELRYQ